MLKGRNILLAVTGSIAAYKAASLASMLVKQHADVHVIMTKNAEQFISPVTFETLTGNKVIDDTFDRNSGYHVAHIAMAQEADVVMIAPDLNYRKCHIDCIIYAFSHFNIGRGQEQDRKIIPLLFPP